MTQEFTAKRLADHIGAALEGDGDRKVTGVASLENAGPEDLVFVEGDLFADALHASASRVAILPEGITPNSEMTVLRFSRPSLGIALVLDLFFPPQRTYQGVSPGAHVAGDVELGDDVGIAAGAVIGEGARIGRGTELHPNVTVAPGVSIGEDCRLYPGAHLYARTEIGNRVILHAGVVIGADGFGYVQNATPPERATLDEPIYHHKVPQVGKVVIEDDVEIGANSTIDRGAIDETRIRRGSKIDNQVQLAHNCTVGRHSIIVAQSGIAGSTTLEDYVTIAAQVGIVGRLTIGKKATVAAQSGVTKNVGPGQVVWGTPAMEFKTARRAYALLDRLPEFKKLIAALSKRVDALEGEDGS